MRRWSAIGALVSLACAAGIAGANPQDRADRPERSLRLDHDSMRNDYREDRLKIPAHPLFEEQRPAQPPKAKGSSKRDGAASR